MFDLQGVALIVLGFIALSSLWVAGLATALAIGVLLLVSGVPEFVGSIWTRRPAPALWVIGLFVGISLVCRGINWIGLGLAFRAPPPSVAD